MLKWFQQHKTPLLFAVILSLLYWSFAYQLVRSDFVKLITLYATLFYLTHLLIKIQGWNFWILAVLGFFFRLLFFPAIPNLSQDFYRFLWDGQLMAQGYSPYLFTPSDYIKDPSAFGVVISQASQLLDGMGSLNGSHFSNYPPVNQLFFALAGVGMGSSILKGAMILRLLLILADVGILYFGSKLLKSLNLPKHLIFWYFLNPFVIIECTGNLHFEGMMVFFLIAGLYVLQKNKWGISAILWGLSIIAKLIPLMFLPLLHQWFVKQNRSFKKGILNLIGFYVMVGLVIAVSFAPFYSKPFFNNYTTTTALWFQDYEFNASVFYIVRWIGFQTVGWDPIQTAGKILPVIVFLFITGMGFLRKNNSLSSLLTAMLFSISFYLLLATTVHPWYLITPLTVCLFTKYRFPIVWSATVMLSYSAYGENGVAENPWLIALEYLTVAGFALWEIGWRKVKPQKPMLDWQNT